MIISSGITQRKKICLLLPSLSAGGMQRAMSELAGYLCRQNDLEVHLVLFGKDPSLFYLVPENLIIHKPKANFNNRLRFIYSIGRLFYVRRTVRGISPVTVLSFGEYWNNLVLLSLLGLRFPIYISDRSQPGKDLGAFHNFLRNLLYRTASGYIAQTRYAADLAIRKNWNKNVRIIGNPVRQIAPALKPEKENIVLSVGRLVRTKHFDDLVRAFVEIGNPDWKLMIVGGDAQKQTVGKELRALIHSLNAEESVFLEGNQSDTDNYYRRSRIFAFMSSSEGFPNVVGEALSAGLPVVSYDCLAGPSDLISDGKNGFLIPLFDRELFKKKLTLLMANSEIESIMSQAATSSIKNFESGIIGKQFYDFILSHYH